MKRHLASVLLISEIATVTYSDGCYCIPRHSHGSIASPTTSR
jgi:hypothetical protein